MKLIGRIALTLAILGVLVFALPGAAQAAPPQDDKVVFGGSYTLNPGQTLDGNLAVFGGSANLAKDSRVTGNIVLVGGSLDIDSEVDKNVSAMGGSLFINDNAVIHGDVTMLGATLHRSPQAKILGQIVNGSENPLQFSVPGGIFTPRLGIDLKPLGDALWLLFRSLATAALAILLLLFIPIPTERVARAIVDQPILSGALGLLTVIVVPIVLIVISITIILIPVTLLGVLLVAVAVLFGWIAVGLEVGRRILGLFHVDLALPLAAGLGTFIMTLVVNSIGFIPCVGWIAPFLVVLLGLGGIILTRFGTQSYLGPAVTAQPSYPQPNPYPPTPRSENNPPPPTSGA